MKKMFYVSASVCSRPGVGRSLRDLVDFLSELPGIERARKHGTKRGKPIGQQPLPRHKAAVIRAELSKGTGIIKTARCGTGVRVVQRIKREMMSEARH